MAVFELFGKLPFRHPITSLVSEFYHKDSEWPYADIHSLREELLVWFDENNIVAIPFTLIESYYGFDPQNKKLRMRRIGLALEIPDLHHALLFKLTWM